MNTPSRILITPGEPAGIGPDLTIMVAQQSWPVEIVVLASPELLLARAMQLKLPLKLIEINSDDQPSVNAKSTLKIIPVALAAAVKPGILDKANAGYVLQTLEMAASLCQQKKARSLVTGPVHKGIINDAGVAFSGHTEFFAALSQVKQTVMLFVVDELKVALATTHLALADVPAAITKERLATTLTILQQALKEQFKIISPRIAVCGLNPHAGEGGYLGREEIDIISPLLTELREKGFTLLGPLPADTAFTHKQLREVDAVLAMYHDQALPLVKYKGFGHAVNMTLGLPYVRTSVDHGTALDLAGSGEADAGSLMAALALAIELTKCQQ